MAGGRIKEDLSDAFKEEGQDLPLLIERYRDYKKIIPGGDIYFQIDEDL